MASIGRSAKALAENLIEATQHQNLTSKINVQAIARFQDIRKVAQRAAVRSDDINPLIQAKLAQMR